MTNPNEIEHYGLTPEQTDAVFEQTGRQLMVEAAARQRLAEWPSLVDRILNRLMHRSADDRDALTAINARLTVLEGKMGLRTD